MYSVTKTFTAALVLELEKTGVFSLEDPVANSCLYTSSTRDEQRVTYPAITCS
jgi:hypothetical protein